VSARELDHGGREVDSPKLRLRHTLGGENRELAGAAADVEHAARGSDVRENVVGDRRKDLAERCLDAAVVRAREPAVHRSFAGHENRCGSQEIALEPGDHQEKREDDDRTDARPEDEEMRERGADH
jgi:hypothetical protein